MTPIIEAIEDAKRKFLAQYNFPAECIHVSPSIEKALSRLLDGKQGKLREAEVSGLGVFRATKATPHAEFWLTAERDGQVFAQHARLQPHEADGKVIQHPGVTVLGDD